MAWWCEFACRSGGGHPGRGQHKVSADDGAHAQINTLNTVSSARLQFRYHTRQGKGWSMTMRGYTVVAVLGLAFCMPLAVAAQTPAIASSTPAPASDADLVKARCIAGE